MAMMIRNARPLLDATAQTRVVLKCLHSSSGNLSEKLEPVSDAISEFMSKTTETLTRSCENLKFIMGEDDKDPFENVTELPTVPENKPLEITTTETTSIRTTVSNSL